MKRYLAAIEPAAAGAADGVALVGVPYDGAVTYRSGAAAGPPGIRAASESIETHCPKLDLDLEDGGRVVDYGDLALEPTTDGAAAVSEITRALADRSIPPARRVLALGGDHLVAYPFLRAAIDRHPRLTVLHVDAHLDMRAEWEGDPFNHATVLGRALDHAAAIGAALRLVSWGIRSGTRDEYALARRDRRVTVLDADATSAAALDALSGSDPVYVTLDVDGVDPSEIPGTGTPEPAGLRFGAVEHVLGALRDRDVVGADIVELAPALDPTGRSVVAGARLARTLLLVLREAARRRSATVGS